MIAFLAAFAMDYFGGPVYWLLLADNGPFDGNMRAYVLDSISGSMHCGELSVHHKRHS